MGSGVKNFQSFEILTSADVDNYLMTQSVMVLPGASAIGTAGTAIGTATTATQSPAEGMLVYLTDVNQYQMNLDGSASGWYPVAGQMPRCELTKTTDQSVNSGAYTTITGWTQTEIRGGFSESSGVVTVPYTGRYSITANISWTTGSGGTRIVAFAFNAATAPSLPGNAVTPATTFTHQSISSVVKLTANDTIKVLAYQSSGAALAVNGAGFGGNGLKFTIEYVGP